MNTIFITDEIESGFLAKDDLDPFRFSPVSSYAVALQTEASTGGHQGQHTTATDGSDVVQSGRPIFDNFFQHLWPYMGNNTVNVVFQMVKRSWLNRIDQ
ncbi:hypothetical protein TNCV_1818891 [Trichonephila clavipes]|nr:hypothetical protein TNCV_1818891 [Trichonephila clavipes]